jgi:hypothetical protein
MGEASLRKRWELSDVGNDIFRWLLDNVYLFNIDVFSNRVAIDGG